MRIGLFYFSLAFQSDGEPVFRGRNICGYVRVQHVEADDLLAALKFSAPREDEVLMNACTLEGETPDALGVFGQI